MYIPTGENDAENLSKLVWKNLLMSIADRLEIEVE